ncbi:DUF2207 domain-containing protein, partial [Candidatus Saccharibacteria bacterium]|nr:DUF2207 domain-containing protein [Candidatus Saccharibacteria bacterium]
FTSDIFIPQTGKVQVTETILADFGSILKHGIYRTISTENMKFKLISVNQDGVRATTKVTSSGGIVKIRIGEEDQLIEGQHTYKIEYEVGKVITRFGDHDEFYWDVTGSDWTVPINRAITSVSLEGGRIQEVTCYTGPFGSREQDCHSSLIEGGARFETTSPLFRGEGLTVVNRLPKGLVGEPSYPEDTYQPLWMILGSLVAAAFALYQWWRHGRDMWYRQNIILNPQAKPETKPLFAREMVVAEFDPPRTDGDRELRPAEVGTLIDEKVDIHDISATIVDLAVRGYLKIGEKKKKGRKTIYWFEKLKDFNGDEKLVPYESKILEGLFEGGDRVELDDLKDKFYKHLEDIKNKLYEQMREEGYFGQR